MRSFSMILLMMVAFAFSAPVHASQPDDPLLNTLKLELTRNAEKLALDDYAGPYFISYRIKDRKQHDVIARFGALVDQKSSRDRLAYVDVRVGDYALDNSEDEEGQSYEEMSLVQAPTTLPIEMHEEAIRRGLWLLTDQRYKEALTAYHRVKASRIYKVDKKGGSFTQEQPVQFYQETKPLQFAQKKWKDIARTLSRDLGNMDHILDATVNVFVRDETQYLVSTEGTELITQQVLFGFQAYAMTVAEDGMVLDHSVNFYAPSEEGLPGKEALQKAVSNMGKELLQLRGAPVLAPYTGPAILLPRAAGVLFHEAIGHRLEGHRQENPEEGRTFAGQLGTKVIPAFLSVVDDPTQDSFEGTNLNGFYRYDDEGVAAQAAMLIEDGVLRNFLMRRQPVEGLTRSNGHGRAQGNARPVARMANLFVKAQETQPLEELEKTLLAEVRAAGKPFGLIVGDIAGGSTNTMTYGYQAFKGEARMVYKVDAKSGKKTLVRGVEIVGTPLSSINKIVAASGIAGVFNGYCGAESGYVPVSTIAPALLLREVELQRSVKSNQRGPILPRPQGHLKGMVR